MIDSFTGTFGFLSNFSPDSVMFDAYVYPTAEHAFQAAKTLSLEERLRIRNLKTPGMAKRAGRAVKLRHDWESVKVNVMEQIVRSKFARSAHLRRCLMATGQNELVEGNTWGDTFWGVCRGKGQNHLGKILMKIRAEIFNNSLQENL